MKLNNKGAVLISVYMVLFVLMALSSSVALFNFSELRDAKRYQNSTSAFWLAEAGINQFMSNTEMLDDQEFQLISQENGTIKITKSDSDPRYRYVTSTGIVGGIQRQIQIQYPALTNIFERTVSTKGDIIIEGQKSSLFINDMTRLGGNVLNNSANSLIYFEDKKEDVNDPLVSITYPDVNRNGVADEFDDFVAYNRNLIASYPESEVIYIKGNETYTILPDSSLEGKKIIFIEGDQEGEGNAVIQLSSALGRDHNLTIITTGTVTNNQAGIADNNAQLNIIAWSDYYETAILPTIHNGMIYTHGKAYFDEIHDTSITNGSIVANDGIVFREIWSTKTFNYVDTRARGVVPPGFEGLVGGGVSGYAPNPSTWREI